MNEKLICLLKQAETWARYNRANSCSVSGGEVDVITNYMEELKGAIKKLEHGLACGSEEAHNQSVSERHERDNDCLIHALHDLRVELVRTTEGLRSLSIVLTKSDLGNTEKINMKVSELAGSLNEVKAGALKGFSEVRNRIDAADTRIVILEKSLADADIPAEAEAALADLKVIAKQLDDIVPDAPELPPVTPPLTPA